jgi:hypothetical protein
LLKTIRVRVSVFIGIFESQFGLMVTLI